MMFGNAYFGQLRRIVLSYDDPDVLIQFESDNENTTLEYDNFMPINELVPYDAKNI